MDTKLFVIALAAGTVVLTTLIQVFTQGRDPGPRARRLLWISLVAGIIALVAVATIYLGR